MNTNMTGLDGFQKSLHPCALDERITFALEGLNTDIRYLCKLLRKLFCKYEVM